MAPSASQIVIVASVWIGHVLGLGGVYGFGIFLPAIMEEFDISKAEAASVISMMTLLFFMGGVVSGKLGPKIGFRMTAWLGVFLAVIGLQLAALAVDFWMMYSLLFTGLGFNFMWTSGLSTISINFDQKSRAGASAVATTGVGCGVILIGATVPRLIQSMGLRDTLRILSAIYGGLGCIGAAGYLPPKAQPVAQVGSKVSVKDPPPGQKDIPLLKDPLFRFFTLALFFVPLGLFVPFAHLAAHAVQQGLGPEVYSLAYQMFGITSIFGRLSAGVLAQKLPVITIWSAGMFAVSACNIGFAFSTSGLVMVGIMFLYGLATGPMFALFMPILAELVGVQRVPMAMGLVMFINGAGSFVGPILAGALADVSGNYIISFCTAGFFTFMSACLMTMLKRFVDKKKMQEAQVAAPEKPKEAFVDK
eukprot:gnl/MRDRNA2_/MRDRNA2_80868_c0_seq1.p1 gnl/MRDRNA2_/MRDRNA2_80868_c0~~gnl/MRDRNA2_/MRDRNA2_80868_c0_seq1.p1  ORF type:complete len:419 (-),score=66.94 gnl/MRDRNA2_/MRDRNA2_80868_c0_seq1:254-1510(-)